MALRLPRKAGAKTRVGADEPGANRRQAASHIQGVELTLQLLKAARPSGELEGLRPGKCVR